MKVGRLSAHAKVPAACVGGPANTAWSYHERTKLAKRIVPSLVPPANCMKLGES